MNTLPMDIYNKTIRSNIKPNRPYYFITAHLDIAKIIPSEANQNFKFMLYFNKENNFNYRDHPDIDNYRHYWTFVDNCVIGDVTFYTSPSINKTNTLEDVSILYIKAGLTGPPTSGSYTFGDQWTGLTGITPTNLVNTVTVVNLDYTSQLLSIGRSPNIINDQKYLGLYIEGFTSSLPQPYRSNISVHVVIKVYPKNT
jgi:hypothetical protein